MSNESVKPSRRAQSETKGPGSDIERRKRTDRRREDRRVGARRLADMRWGGIGEVQPERRDAERRSTVRRSSTPRRESS